MTKEELKDMVNTLRERYKVAPHEVVLVGERKLPTAELPEYDGNTVDEAKAYLTEHYKFTRNSLVRPAGAAVGQKSTKFFHLLVAQPSGETVQLPDGRTVKRSNRTNKYGWFTLFEREGITFDEIKTEVQSKSFDVVGSPKDGKIRLTQYVLMGAWIEADAGFKFKLFQQDKTGKLVPLMANRKDDAGKFTPVQAEDRMIRMFVLETQYETMETLLANRLNEVEKHKIKEDAPSSDPNVKDVVVQGATEVVETAEEADV